MLLFENVAQAHIDRLTRSIESRKGVVPRRDIDQVKDNIEGCQLEVWKQALDIHKEDARLSNKIAIVCEYRDVPPSTPALYIVGRFSGIQSGVLLFDYVDGFGARNAAVDRAREIKNGWAK